MVVLSTGEDSVRRTEVLDGVRMLKFRDVFGRCEQGSWRRRNCWGSMSEHFAAGAGDMRKTAKLAYWTGGSASHPRNAFLLPRSSRSDGSTRTAMRGSRPSISTSTWCRPTASAGATVGPRPIFRTAAIFRRRHGVERTVASDRVSHYPE